MSAEFDVVGVGIGPFNLALAALAEPVEGLSALFLDADEEFRWHPGLLLEGATLQVPFLADLVTLADPRSRWSFLEYLRVHDRLYPFYFAETMHPSRREYDDYLRWVAREVGSCRFGRRVTSVGWDDVAERFVVEHVGADGSLEHVRARHVVLGVGTEPITPPAFDDVAGPRVLHSGAYLDRLDELDGVDDVTVVGSGQSGAEVFLDQLRRAAGEPRRLRWLTAAPAFAPMEYSRLGLEHFTPAYSAYFRSLPQEVRDDLVPRQWQLYKATSAETLADVHAALYARDVDGRAKDVELRPNVVVETAVREDDGGLRLGCRHAEQDGRFDVRTGAVVLATGYAATPPPLLEKDLVAWDEQGRYRVDDDFRVALAPGVTGSLFVQNAELHSHGIGAPDLGLGAWRAATITNALAGRVVYDPPTRTSFTSFGT